MISTENVGNFTMEDNFLVLFAKRVYAVILIPPSATFAGVDA